MEFERWRKKKAKALKDGDVGQLIVCCKELADHHVFQENYRDALEEYKEMQRAAEAMNSEMDVARANRMIGEMYCELGEFDQAVHHQQKHLDTAKTQGDKVEEQRALATLGRTYFMMSESDLSRKTAALAKAKQFFTDSLSVCDQLSDCSVGSKQRMEMKARLFLNLGLVHDDEGRVTAAIDYIQQAVVICRKYDLWEDLFKVYNGLGCTYSKNGMKKEAISIFDKAIPVAERLSTKAVSLCEILVHKAEALLDLPDFRGARQTLLRAHKLKCPSSVLRMDIEKKLRVVAAMCETEAKLTELSPDGQNEERKKLYENLADMAAEMRVFSIALMYYTLMLQCVEKSGGDPKALIECYVSLAQTYKDDKQYKKAIEFFKKEVALEKDNHEESCKTYLNIAELYHVMGKNANALEAYKAAKNCAIATKNGKLLKMVLGNLKQHYIEIGMEDEVDLLRPEIDNLDCGDWESSDEENESDKEMASFGADINLDDLSDPEGDAEDGENVRMSRSRVKPKSNIHKKNELGETPLHRAAITGNFALATKLLDQGHSVDVRDYSGWTPLHEAANHGHLEIAALLIKKGAAVNDRGGGECNGVTPLLDAASCGHFHVMELLLQHKASPLMKNNDGMSVLDLMSEWKVHAERENGGALDRETLAEYEAMHSKLLQILERAGHKPSHKHLTPMKTSPGASVDLRRTNTRRLVYEEDDDDINVKMPVRREEDFVVPSRPQSRNGRRGGAANDYESTMRAIRFRTKDQGHSSLATEPKPALIPASDIVGDDWLEEDICRPNKKRKTNEFIGEPQRRRKSDDAPSHSPSPVPELAPPDMFDDDLDWNSVVEPTLHTSATPTDHHSASTSGTCSNRLKVMNMTRRKDISLSTNGVSREKIVRTDSASRQTSPHAVTSSSMVCMRVLVEGKLLLVPIPSNNDHLKIEWLAEETAKRYKCLEGVEPKLRLLTADGAILLNSDPLSLVLSMGELQGTVLSWNLPSLMGSYEEQCRNNNLSQDSSVVAILESCPATSSADFSDTYLDSKHLMCAVKVLSLQHTLHSINLSGICISDGNMKELAENLVKLPLLRYLNLSSVNMSSEGLAVLSQIVVSLRGFQRLQSLDVGFNPLGDCLKPLGDLISNLPALTRLALPAVDLVTQSFRAHLDFTLDTLESINVNYNDIGTEGVIDLLGRLNPRSIQELLLAHTGGKTIREVGLYLQVNSPPSLRSLDLSYCPASEEDMHEFIQGLEMCPHLEKLGLEGVCGLDHKNVHALISRHSVRHLNLAGSVDALAAGSVVVEHLASLAISSCGDHDWPQRKGPFGLYAAGPLKNPVIHN